MLRVVIAFASLLLGCAASVSPRPASMVWPNASPVAAPQSEPAPQVAAAPVAEVAPGGTLAVDIAADGSVQLGRRPLSHSQLEAEARAAVERDPDVAVVIHAAAGAAYARVIEVMDLLRATGVTRLSLSVRPTP